MPPSKCSECLTKPANVRRSLDRSLVCSECFSKLFEDEVYAECQRVHLFDSDPTLIAAVSGGKDSCVLVFVLLRIAARYCLPLRIELLAVDEGIAGYRDGSLEHVKAFSAEHSLNVTFMSFDEMFEGYTMDKVVGLTGQECSCTYCGVFRRRALDSGVDTISRRVKNPVLLTGHNLDDFVETVLLNILRGDAKRLRICESDTDVGSGHRRIKPLSMQFEREIVLYAHLNRLSYHSTECTYAEDAFRSHCREFVRKLQRISPKSLIAIKDSSRIIAERLRAEPRMVQVGKCEKCGQTASSTLCNVCKLVGDLNEFQMNENKSN